MIFVTRSLKIGLASLLPNLAPAAIGFGVWGLLVGQVGLAVSVVVGMTPELAAEFGMATCSAELRTGCLDEYWVAVWFGVLFVMNIQIYFLSPPFGPACFWLKSVVPQAKDMPDGKEITLQEIFLSVLPFIALQILGMLLVLFFPFIALWMPQALGS